jgi:ATP-binding cassette subfamily F protein 3
VSHDRYFINQTATRILDLTGQTIVNYIGNYDYYLEKQEELTRIYVSAPDGDTQAVTGSGDESGKTDWQEQKKQQAALRKQQNELKKTEEEIARLEQEREALETECAKPDVATNSARLFELHSRITEIDEKLEGLYENWELLAEDCGGT